METTIPNNVLIVGAGLSGLATADALMRRSIAVTILEAQDRVAEPWRRRHPALRLNIHRHFAQLPGMAPPRADGAYLRRESVVSYLERYARQIGVPIRFGVTVEAIERDACTWLLRTSAGVFGAAHVIFATGYPSRLEPLVGHLGVLGARGSPLRPAGEPDPKHQGLWFTGYFEAARIAAKCIGKGIASDLQRPAQSSSSVDQRNIVPKAAES